MSYMRDFPPQNGWTFCPRLFFCTTHEKKESDFNTTVKSLYAGVKESPVPDPHLSAVIRKTGKEATIQKLCELLNAKMDTVLTMDLTTARRHLLAYHSRLAFETKERQRAAEAMKQRK